MNADEQKATRKLSLVTLHECRRLARMSDEEFEKHIDALRNDVNAPSTTPAERAFNELFKEHEVIADKVHDEVMNDVDAKAVTLVDWISIWIDRKGDDKMQLAVKEWEEQNAERIKGVLASLERQWEQEDLRRMTRKQKCQWLIERMNKDPKAYRRF